MDPISWMLCIETNDAFIRTEHFITTRPVTNEDITNAIIVSFTNNNQIHYKAYDIEEILFVATDGDTTMIEDIEISDVWPRCFDGKFKKQFRKKGGENKFNG